MRSLSGGPQERLQFASAVPRVWTDKPSVAAPLVLPTSARSRSLRAFLHFPHNLAPDFPHYSSWKGFEKMKYLYCLMIWIQKCRVAVGEQVSAELRDIVQAWQLEFFQANLLAEEIDLEKQLPTEPQCGKV